MNFDDLRLQKIEKKVVVETYAYSHAHIYIYNYIYTYIYIYLEPICPLLFLQKKVFSIKTRVV